MDAEYIKKLSENFKKSENTVDVPVTLFGNKNTIIGIVSLLGYIRNIINSDTHKTITIEIGKTIENDRFDFLLDDETVPDMKAVDNVQIN
jgi:hypothetical protein